MGLEFNDNGVIRILTVEDMQTDLFREAYFDLYKGLNDIKPRWYTSPEDMLRFFDTYEAQLEEHKAREAEELARLSERDGIQYRSWMHYYDEKERRDHEAWERQNAERQAKADYQEELRRRWSPLAVIRMWEYGMI
jgi:hypothetical protein